MPKEKKAKDLKKGEKVLHDGVVYEVYSVEDDIESSGVGLYVVLNDEHGRLVELDLSREQGKKFTVVEEVK